MNVTGRFQRRPEHSAHATTSMPIGPLALFLVLLVIFVALTDMLTPWSTDAGAAIGGLIIMWCPAAAAAIVSLQRIGWGDPGWRWPATRFLALAYLVPVIYCVSPFVIDRFAENGRFTLEHWATYSEHLGLGRSIWLGPLLLATLEPVFAMLSAAGEEIGWRGFLLPALLQRYRFWGAVAISWLVWFAFHLPGIVSGNYGATGAPAWFAIACFAAMLLASTIIMSWLRVASRSLWPCIVAHAVHNVFIQEIAPSAFSGGKFAPWLVGEFGLLTAIIGAALAFGFAYRINSTLA